ncbi:MAG TPA: hypothetical protein VN714_03755, partial [Trebonia sp.]|nr:hypothetical protein [Trebonia sp.]
MTHKWQRWLAPGAALTAAAVLAACSSSSSTTCSTSASSPAASSAASSAAASGGDTSSSGVAKAQAMVSQLEATTTKYPVPTTSISGVSGLKG